MTNSPSRQEEEDAQSSCWSYLVTFLQGHTAVFKALKTALDVYEHENVSVGESLRQLYEFSGGRFIKAGKQPPLGAEVESAAAIVAAVRC